MPASRLYGRGAAETAWGEIRSGRPRDSHVLATRVWGRMSDDPTLGGDAPGATDLVVAHMGGGDSQLLGRPASR